MNIQRFAENFEEARRTSLVIVETKNNIAREHASDLLEKTIEIMVEELNTIIDKDRICKDALLRNLLEDAEIRNQYWNS